MANNRMFIKCTVCGKKLFLAKYYPSIGWYFPEPPGLVLRVRTVREYRKQAIERSIWLNEHAECGESSYSMESPRHFILAYDRKEKE